MIRLTPTIPLSANVPLRLAAKMPLLTPTDEEDHGTAQRDRQRRREPREQVVGDVDAQLERDAEAGRVALDRDRAGLEVVADEDALHVLAVLLDHGLVEAEARR